MTLEDKVHTFQLLLYHRSQELRNVSATCRELRVSLSLYYQLPQLFTRYVPHSLHPTLLPNPPSPPSQLHATVQRHIFPLSLSSPTCGPRQLSHQLSLLLILVSASTAYPALRLLSSATQT